MDGGNIFILMVNITRGLLLMESHMEKADLLNKMVITIKEILN